MPKSERPRLHEIRRVHDLVHRISECGDRPDIWRRLALEGLIDLLGGNVGLTVDLRLPPGGPLSFIDQIDIGWQTESARRRFQQYAASDVMAEDPGAQALFSAQRQARFLNRTRRELVDDATWYRSPAVQEARRSGDVDDFVISSVAVSNIATHGLIVYRSWNDRPFTTRHRRIMQLFRLELTRAIRDSHGPQLIFGDLPPLAPRLRQTLELMLSPLSLKEIAEQLQLSRHTVNDYQKSLYRIFNVNSRAALMCLFRPTRRPIRLPDGLV